MNRDGTYNWYDIYKVSDGFEVRKEKMRFAKVLEAEVIFTSDDYYACADFISEALKEDPTANGLDIFLGSGKDVKAKYEDWR